MTAEAIREVLCLAACAAVPLVGFAGMVLAVVKLNRELSKSAAAGAERLRDRLYEQGEVCMELDDVAIRYVGHAFIAAGVQWYHGRVIVTSRALYLLPHTRMWAGLVHHRPTVSIPWRDGAIPAAISNYRAHAVEHDSGSVTVRVRRHIERGAWRLSTPRAAELAALLAQTASVPSGFAN